MQFFHILTILSTSLGAVLAADICRPTGSDCFGTAVCCLGIQQGNCCNTGASNRIRWVLPANSRAQGWTGSGCTGTSTTTQNPNARTVCLTYSAIQNSGKWLTGLSSRVRRDSDTEECAEPNGLLDVVNGETVRYDLPEGMSADEALAAKDAGQLKAVPYVGDYQTTTSD